jgi:hypothetical protein
MENKNGIYIENYPKEKTLQKWETLQAFNLAAQAILAFDPNFSMARIRKALGNAKSPEGLSRAMRARLPSNYFGIKKVR